MKNNDMKLIMESWRSYVNESDEILSEGKIFDAIRDGFKKLVSAPSKFDEMVNSAKLSFEKIFMDKIEELKNDKELASTISKVANDINNADEEMLSEIIREADDEGEQKSISFAELEQILDESELNKIKEKIMDAHAESVVEACESAVGQGAPPRVRDFLVRFIKRASKMIVFGFIDNFIMIIAGDAIDTNIAQTLGYSTMAAAGLGNMLSDIGGEVAGAKVEKTLNDMGFDVSPVSDEEMENESVPGWMKFMDKNAGAFGVAIGCILGMVPLLFKENEETI
jgi:rRNA maturation endonuclease Nob1